MHVVERGPECLFYLFQMARLSVVRNGRFFVPVTPEVVVLENRMSEALRAIGMNAHDVLLKPVHELSLLSERIRGIAGVGRP